MMTRRYLVIFLGFVLVRTEECLHGSTSGNCSSTSLNDNDPCRNVQCKEGEYCKLHQVQCIRAPCPPVASCEPKLCENGEPLIVEYTGKPVVCGNGTGVTCPDSYDCKSSLAGDQKMCCPRTKQNQCRLLKCKTCKSGFYKYDKKGCQTCDCEDPCLDHKCKKGETCTAFQVQCIRAPCPPPINVCIHECPLKKCAKNCDYNKSDKYRCRTCECIEDPCLKHPCKDGQICKLEVVQCFRPPCPFIPKCIHNCPQVKCATYCHHYKYDKNGCQTCECYDPCINVKCTENTHCLGQEVICKRAPCLPIGTCVSKTGWN